MASLLVSLESFLWARLTFSDTCNFKSRFNNGQSPQVLVMSLVDVDTICLHLAGTIKHCHTTSPNIVIGMICLHEHM